jgi:hypothetical protein
MGRMAIAQRTMLQVLTSLLTLDRWRGGRRHMSWPCSDSRPGVGEWGEGRHAGIGGGWLIIGPFMSNLEIATFVDPCWVSTTCPSVGWGWTDADMPCSLACGLRSEPPVAETMCGRES